MAADATHQGLGLQRRRDGTTAIPSGGSLDIESGGALKIAGVAITATAAEINAIAGGGLSGAELAVLDAVTPGTVAASKALVVDANKDLASLRDVTVRDLKPESITAVDASLGIAGLAAAQGGDVVIAAGTSSGGNAGGVASVTGGIGGTNSAGGVGKVVGGAGTGTGNGGAAQVTGGASGAGATGAGGGVALAGGAAGSTNGGGGSIVLTPGAKAGTGIAGGNFLRSATAMHFEQRAAAVAKTDGDASLSAAEMINGIVVHTVSTGRTLTTPTGAAIDAGCPADIGVGDCFLLHVITVGTGADDISTLTAGDGAVTFVGRVTVGPDAANNNGYGTFLFRRTGVGTWVGYRIG